MRDINGGAGSASAGSAAGSAYEILRDQIMTLALPPGTPLNESTLAEQHGLGLTPFRDAIKRLALEHLLVVYPRRGTFVSEINLADERWLTEVRIEMEGLAAELAASRASDEERAWISRCAAEIGDERDAPDLNALDTQFHRLIYRAAHNPFLEPMLHQYLNLSVRLWYYCRDRLPPNTTGGKFHRQVADAIKNRNPAEARKGMVAHLRQSSIDLRAVM